MSSEPSSNGDSLARRVVQALERNTAAFERHAEASDRHAAVLERNSAVLERNSAAFERHAAALDGQRDTFRVQAEIFEAGFRGVIEKLDGMAGDIRANTQAVLRLLDRFEGGPHPST